MSITEIMRIGTSGMTAEQKDEEQARRMKVVDRINYIGTMTDRINVQLQLLPANYKACKIWKNKKSRYNRELKRIKANESEWLRQAAWFMYV